MQTNRPIMSLCGVVVLVAFGACNSESGTTGVDGGAVPDIGAGAGGPCNGPCQVSLLTGAPGGPGAVEGTGKAARLRNVRGIASDGKFLFLAEAGSGVVRRVELATRRTSSLAGKLGDWGPHKDGKGEGARFQFPEAIAYQGDTVFVVDDRRLRKVSASGEVVTVNDPATNSPWEMSLPTSRYLTGLALVGGKLYIADTRAIWVHDLSTGDFVLFAGSLEHDGFDDGPVKDARFTQIVGLATDGTALFVADTCVIRKVDLQSGTVATFAGQTSGGGCVSGPTDGTGSAAKFWPISGLDYAAGNLYVVEYPDLTHPTVYSGTMAPYFGQVREVRLSDQRVTTVAGQTVSANTRVGELDGPAASARIFLPLSVHALNDTVFVGSYSAVRALSGGQLETLVGALLEGPLLRPGPVAVSGDQLYAVSNGRHEILRVRTSDGAVDVVQRYDDASFRLYHARGMTAAGGALFVVVGDAVLTYDTKTGKTRHHFSIPQPLIGRAIAASGGDLLVGVEAADGQVAILAVSATEGKGHTVVAKDLALPPAEFGLVSVSNTIYLAGGGALLGLERSSGKLTPVAGSLTQTGCAAGTGGTARFTRLGGAATDGQFIYVGDRLCHTVSRIDPATGEVVILGGAATNPLFKAGEGSDAGLNNPLFLAHHDGWLFVSDPFDNVLIKIGPLGSDKTR
jgi:DNA-binding beta-propeller fold protein YncE